MRIITFPHCIEYTEEDFGEVTQFPAKQRNKPKLLNTGIQDLLVPFSLILRSWHPYTKHTDPIKIVKMITVRYKFTSLKC